MISTKQIDDAIERIFQAPDTTNFVRLVTIAGLNPSEDFRFSNMSHLDFSNCDLRSFDFTGASIENATFKGARIAEAIFENVIGDLDCLREAADWELYSRRHNAKHAIAGKEQEDVQTRGNPGIAAAFRRLTEAFLDEYLGSEDVSVPFGGRNAELKCLDDWICDPNASPRMLIAGAAGRGKSALLARWQKSLRERGTVAEAGWQLAFIPISTRFGTHTPGIFLRMLAHRLAEINSMPIAPKSVQSLDALKDLIRGQLERAATARQRVLVVIDGLDEALQGDFDSSIIPTRLPSNVRVLVSARWQVGDHDSAGWLRRLGWDRGIRTDALELDRLSADAIAEILTKAGAHHLERQPRFIEHLSTLTEGEPILVRYYVEDLGHLGGRSAQIAETDLQSVGPGFGSYLKRWLSHQELLWADEAADVDKLEIDQVLSILAFALGPLESRDLLGLMKEIYQSDVRFSEHIPLRHLERLVIGNGTANSGYVLSHSKIAEYLRNERFSSNATTVRRGFVTWGQKHLRSLNSGNLEARDASPYALQFLKDHFKDVEVPALEWMEMVETGWRNAWERFEGGPRGFSGDVEAAWSTIRHNDSQLNLVGEQWRCALTLSSIKSIGANIPDALLFAAVAHKKLSIWQTIHFVEVGRSSVDVIAFLLRLSQLDTISEVQRNDLISMAVETADSFHLESNRALAIGLLAPYLAQDQIGETIATAIAIRDEKHRAYALGSLAPRLTPDQISDAFVTTIAIADEWDRAHALGAFAPHLAPNQIAEALASATAIRNEEHRAHALGSLAPYLTPDQITEAFAAAKEIKDDEDRAQALGSLAPHLASGQIAEALDAAKAIGNEQYRARALGSLAPHLTPDQITAAFVAAKAIEDDEDRAHALGSLATHLAPNQIAEALDAAMAIGNEQYRVRALVFIAPYLSPDQLNESLDAAKIERELFRAEVLRLAPNLRQDDIVEKPVAREAIDNERYRAQSLASLASHLTPNEIAKRFAAAKAIGDKEDRARVLGLLAPYLAPDQITDALVAAQAIDDEWSRAFTLGLLVPHLAPDDRSQTLADAFAAALAIGDEQHRAHALGLVAPHLKPDQIAAALAAAMAIGDEEYRAKALGSLAPHLTRGQITAACSAATAIRSECYRAQLVVSLAPHMAPDQITAMYAAVTALRDERYRAQMVGSLAPHLAPDEIAKSFTEAMAIDYEGYRAQALGSLAPHLTPYQVTEALAAATAIRNEQHRAYALGSLAPRLTPDQISEAFVTTISITDGWDRAHALGAFAPHLAPNQIAEALASAIAIKDEQHRAHALGSLASYLVPNQITEAFVAAKAIKDDEDRAQALGLLAPHLAPNQIAEALDAVMAIGNEQYRARALGSLAPHLTPDQTNEAFAAAMAIGPVWNRTKALTFIISNFSPSQSGAMESILLMAAKLQRKQALNVISASINISAAMGGAKALKEICRAISDTARWYP